MINYTTLREMKVHINHVGLMDDPVVEEKDLEETENISINKFFEIHQSITIKVRELKKVIKRDVILMRDNDF